MKRNEISPKQFCFETVEYTEIKKELEEMDAKKSTTDKNIPIKHLKVTSDICCDILSEIINNEIKNNKFPDELKLADITPIHKRGDATRTKNYRPVNVLPPISKIFEFFLQK